MSSPAAAAHPPAAPGESRWSRSLMLLLAFLICTTLAFVGGYYLQKRSDLKALQIEPPRPVPSPAPTVASPAPTEAGKLQQVPDLPEAKRDTILGPRATLEAFLAAPDWASRSAYIIDPVRVGPLLETRAADKPDGPLEPTGLSLSQVSDDSHIFRVRTPAMPDGIYAAVLKRGNDWMVDAETFFEFHDDRFNEFVRGRRPKQETFHLFVKPLETEAPNELFVAYTLTAPIPGRTHPAYARRDANPHARLRSIFESASSLANEDFLKLLENNGPPLTLVLTRETGPDGRAFIIIERVVSFGWNP